MRTIKKSTDRLRDAIDDSLRALESARSTLVNTLREIPNEPENAPVAAAVEMLGHFGFCVVHKDQLDAAIDCVTVAAEGDHETREEDERLEGLLAYLESQRHFAI